VSDTVVYAVRLGLAIQGVTAVDSYPLPKRTGSITIDNIVGVTRFISGSNELYYEMSLFTADDDIEIFGSEEVKLNSQNKFSKVYEYIPPGVYRIKVRDFAGCVKTQDVEVGLDPRVFVPNIFTPNDDSVNDEFEVINLSLTGQHQIIISNRWGNEVFTSKDYRVGTFWNGEDVPDGIYYYRLKIAGGDTVTGWVEVLRGSRP
jgi:gliding motility-associated-like protein